MTGGTEKHRNSPLDLDQCCTPPTDPRIARHFDYKVRERLASGELPGLHSVSQHMLEQLADVGENRPSILELGCGSGALTVALLGARSLPSDGRDLSAASIEVAEDRATTAGVQDRTDFQVGDGASVRLEMHDWVVADRMLCCYRDVSGLLANAIPAARRRFAFSVPESAGIAGLRNRLEESFEGVVNVIRGRPCPGYVHDIRIIEGHLADAGFRPLRTRTADRWYVGAFERGSGPE